MLSDQLTLVAKGNSKKLLEFKEYQQYKCMENAFPNKYFMLIDFMNCKILIYDQENVELIQVIEATTLKPTMIKGNEQQTIFICQQQNDQYCIIKAISNPSN